MQAERACSIAGDMAFAMLFCSAGSESLSEAFVSLHQ